MDNIQLSNNRLQVEILKPGQSYKSSRYDHSGIVIQVTLDKHDTFFSRESADGISGMGGIGLSCCWEWMDTQLYDQTNLADYYPMIGIGLVKKTDTIPFYFCKLYPIVPFERELIITDSSVSMRSLPQLSHGIAVDQTKTISIDNNTLTINNTLINVGEKKIETTEFCHNFIRFNELPVNSKYKLILPYQISAKMRRGELSVSPHSYRLRDFEPESNSTAFWINGYEGLSSHWMKILHDDSSLSLLIEDDFPIYRFFSWNAPHAFCPETFIHISLAPGEEKTFIRKYTFNT